MVPDNASVIGPDDVGRIAENEGIPIYVISTRDATQDRGLFDALQTLTGRTGGKLYCARNWQQQAEAFASVREDIGTSYTAYYYPAPNPNHGFRSIKVEMVSPGGKAYRVLARPGYQAIREPQAYQQLRLACTRLDAPPVWIRLVHHGFQLHLRSAVRRSAAAAPVLPPLRNRRRW